MRMDRRLWLYTGFAVPEGVGLARRTIRAAPRPPHALLIGNDTPGMRALLPVLRILFGSSKGSLIADLRPHSTMDQWASLPDLDEQLARINPSVVLIALHPQESEAKIMLTNRVRQAGAEEIWLVRSGIFASRAVPAPIHMDAEGIASWAGRIWSAAGFTRSR